MNTKKIILLQIGIALLFAGAILISSYFMNNSEHSQTITFLLIALWFIPFSYLLKIRSKNHKTRCS